VKGASVGPPEAADRRPAWVLWDLGIVNILCHILRTAIMIYHNGTQVHLRQQKSGERLEIGAMAQDLYGLTERRRSKLV
jgi:hypothetical protein